jgi:hypothetical protein
MGNVNSRSIGQKRALIFGFDYSGQNKLNGPINDGNLASNTLINSFGFPKENITIYNSGDMLVPLTEFIKSSVSGDMNVIHYSGHGEYINGTDYLVREDLTVISSINISNLLYSAAGNFLIVVDACDSGSIINLPYVCSNINNQITQVNNNSFTCSVVNFSAAGRTQKSYEQDQGNGIIYGDFTYDFYTYLSKFPNYNWLSIFDGVYNNIQSIEIPNLNCSNMQLYYQEANTFI